MTTNMKTTDQDEFDVAATCDSCPVTAWTQWGVNWHHNHAPGHSMSSATEKPGDSSTFECQQCPTKTNSVHLAETHERLNEGHDMWEIETENQ